MNFSLHKCTALICRISQVTETRPLLRVFPPVLKNLNAVCFYFERTINTFNPSKKRFPSCLTKEEQFIGATPPLQRFRCVRMSKISAQAGGDDECDRTCNLQNVIKTSRQFQLINCVIKKDIDKTNSSNRLYFHKNLYEHSFSLSSLRGYIYFQCHPWLDICINFRCLHNQDTY